MHSLLAQAGFAAVWISLGMKGNKTNNMNTGIPYIDGSPLLSYLVEQLQSQGFKELTVNDIPSASQHGNLPAVELSLSRSLTDDDGIVHSVVLTTSTSQPELEAAEDIFEDWDPEADPTESPEWAKIIDNTVFDVNVYQVVDALKTAVAAGAVFLDSYPPDEDNEGSSFLVLYMGHDENPGPNTQGFTITIEVSIDEDGQPDTGAPVDEDVDNSADPEKVVSEPRN